MDLLSQSLEAEFRDVLELAWCVLLPVRIPRTVAFFTSGTAPAETRRMPPCSELKHGG